MNIYPYFTNLRSNISYKFSALRTRALQDVLWAKLTGRNFSLAAFPKEIQQNNPNKKLVGIREIRLDQIIGTLNRRSDFDHKFRPLKKHLLNRWVNTFIRLDRDEWSPIVVHKIGEQYYVEDGHHRVSVARSAGMVFIEAKIWEYSTVQKQTEISQRIVCAEHGTSKSYATG
jgi:hypothetical protein